MLQHLPTSGRWLDQPGYRTYFPGHVCLMRGPVFGAVHDACCSYRLIVELGGIGQLLSSGHRTRFWATTPVMSRRTARKVHHHCGRFPKSWASPRGVHHTLNACWCRIDQADLVCTHTAHLKSTGGRECLRLPQRLSHLLFFSPSSTSCAPHYPLATAPPGLIPKGSG